jgi:hypothetical protein
MNLGMFLQQSLGVMLIGVLVIGCTPMPDQGKALGLMSSTVPQDRFPEATAWLFPLLGIDDRENLLRIWQMAMPPSIFAGAKQLVQKVIPDDWAELTRRIPELA